MKKKGRKADVSSICIGVALAISFGQTEEDGAKGQEAEGKLYCALELEVLRKAGL